jgi:epoxyqueuosine reductase
VSAVISPVDKKLLEPLTKRGYQFREVSVDHVPALKAEIEGRLRQGELDPEFYKMRLGWFKFQLPDDLPPAQSVIVVAVPRPSTQATFTWKGRRQPLLLPPTYTAYDEIAQQVTDAIAGLVKKKGYRVAKTELPLKLLAARSGLTQYGRNNVGYVPGMGSFLELVAVYSDLPCSEDAWQEPQMMPACEKCQLCRKACPTGAIPSDRFLLRAERCIVFHNERPATVPFPTWMKASWHNCVVGCLRCQRVCPVDKQFVQWIGEQEEFSEQETGLLLKGTPREKLPAETRAKLDHLSLTDYLEVLPRNLGVFFPKTT